jgi:predicted transcriptional regulator of viral defense system
MDSQALRQIAKLSKASGVLRPRDLARRGIARQYLRIAEQEGLLVRVARGLYSAPDVAATEFHSFAEAAKSSPRGVICLLSALRFYDLTTQNPFEVWLAIGEKDRRPKTRHPPFRIVRFSGAALNFGRTIHVIEGVSVPVFTVAKTVADCFKYRNKIGLDVALEALRECLRQRKATTTEILKAAAVCRVANVMRPYLEALA